MVGANNIPDKVDKVVVKKYQFFKPLPKPTPIILPEVDEDDMYFDTYEFFSDDVVEEIVETDYTPIGFDDPDDGSGGQYF